LAGGLIDFDEAQALLAAQARPIGVERVALDVAHGRVLAEAVTARFASPAADVSVMDGYAVRGADLPGRLLVVGQSFPGAPAESGIRAGEAVRIFTGAALPDGADRVVVQEVARRLGDVVEIGALSGPLFVRRRGSDFAAGDVLLPAGWVLSPRALVSAAAADCGEVAVFRLPRVAILGTGDELVAPGAARHRSGAIADSITIPVAAIVGEAGAQVVTRTLLPDDPVAIRAAAERALEMGDVVVVTGGASVGDKDHGPAVFAAMGLQPIFAKVAIKPGRPVWFGRLGERLVLGLPGNPSSAMVTARLFLAPLLSGLRGGDPELAWQSAPLAQPIAAEGDREAFVRGRWVGSGVSLFSNQDSGSQRVIAEADLLIRRPAGAPPLAAGEEVPILPLEPPLARRGAWA
jgi:molybdopterin molybdotransferase